MAKILVMMSGGVDSSVAAALLKESGHEVTGVTLRLADTPPDSGRVGGCCSLQDVEDARCVAHYLDIPHYSINAKDLFSRTVLQNFREEYLAGRTPNPCYRCNQWIKFDYIFQWAEGLNFDFIATGHYARLEHATDRVLLKKGIDPEKDQSYFLAAIPPHHLSRLLFPLGAMTKEEVRQEALRLNLITAEKTESQELCFAHDLDYRQALPVGTAGEMVNTDGKVVGTHSGISQYTIGQRKGIGLGGGPFYVVRLIPENNQVVIGTASDLYSNRVVVSELNLFRPLQAGERFSGKPRYRHPGAAITLEQFTRDTATLVFDEPQRALTCGQALVLYDGEEVVCGSIIEEIDH